ncbi:hypothetical protein OG233_24780 [Streptomyces sp. NBC_01218]|uniref:hypothetical protein n=1 Tax=Streptomyces sp. NBC_01218 TaxID=2903780 RepID=UPI002E111F2C|nr:hypothetical protein OG233_24780 [Streptomyces sp. NBC_01218]
MAAGGAKPAETASAAPTGAAAPDPAPRTAAASAASRTRRSWPGGTRTATATATATSSASAATTASRSSDDGEAPWKLPRPMVAAAALGGVLLIAVPFVLAGLLGGDSKETAGPVRAPAGYAGPGDSPDGVVPSAEERQAGTAAGRSPGGDRNTSDVPAPGTVPRADGVEPGPGAVGAGAAIPAAPGETPAPVSGAEATGSVAEGAGAGTKSPGTVASSAPAAARTTAAAALAAPKVTHTYTAWNGPHCSSAGASYHEYGSSVTPNDGDQWTTHTGGYSQHGCTGRFRSLPMSGGTGDGDNRVVFAFATGKVASGTCRVSVYVPKDSNVEHVGGNPSFYTVHNGSSSSSSQVGSFSVAQVSNRGRWVSGPTVRFTGGHLALVLHDRGKDYNSSGPTDAHHAVDAVGVSCSG